METIEKVKFDNYEYEVTRISVLNMQVCSNCPPAEMNKVEEAVKLNDPAGTSDNWVLEREGAVAPVKCDSIEGRWHYLFVC